LPSFFVNGKIAKDSMGGKSFDEWQTFQRVVKALMDSKNFNTSKPFATTLPGRKYPDKVFL